MVDLLTSSASTWYTRSDEKLHSESGEAMSATILLADDSPTIQKVVELTFADTGYQVVAVSGGTELLNRLPDVKPEVVICDVIMPDRDGYEVCQTIKSRDPPYPGDPPDGHFRAVRP